MNNANWLITDNGSRWKHNTAFENWLSFKADDSEFWKRLYVGYYKLIDHKFYVNGMKLINRELEKQKKFGGGRALPASNQYLTRDMVYSLHRFGAMFDEYFMFKFYQLNAIGRETFICDKYRFEYYRTLNKAENRIIFDNKGKTFELFGKFYKRDFLAVESENDFKTFAAFIAKHPTFVIKPLDSSGGRGVRKVTLNKENEVSDFFSKEFKKGCFAVEEIIQQAPEMAILHPASINTVRVCTIICKSGIKIFAPFLRVGRGGAIIDNAFAGGLGVTVAPDTGILCSYAQSESGEVFRYHPDTGVPFVGFQLPDWDNAIALSKKLAVIVQSNRCIGWDLAYTSDGWIMVEGNCRGQFVVQQYPDGIGKKKELLEYIADI
ncbi:MAG: hypothetical protein XD75_0267 [Parcubacteria bacterium 33_209]|jgi:hypothetical protein|nr:MAG: hypothetical protein XD75_0267 [Parcubacteria bacterium 33_209]